MKLLRSFEEFIFEAITWLIFYPLTIWRIVTRPLTTMAYSDSEQASADEKRYDDALSPPLLLLLTITLVNAVAGTLHAKDALASVHIGRTLLASAQNLAIFRALLFSLIPLLAAVMLLRRRRVHISRDTLRPPFYAQCYLATPCCIALGAGLALSTHPNVSEGWRLFGAVVLVVTGLWFSVTQIRWFQTELQGGWGAAIWCYAQTLIAATVALLALLIPLVLL